MVDVEQILNLLEIDEKMAHLKLEETNDDKKPMTLETLAIMLFEYPWSSAFHAAASRAILAALSSPHEKLWIPLGVCARDEGSDGGVRHTARRGRGGGREWVGWRSGRRRRRAVCCDDGGSARRDGGEEAAGDREVDHRRGDGKDG